MELYDAILYRKSTRKYSSESIKAEQLQTIMNIIEEAERLNDKINMKIHLVTEGCKMYKLLPGIIGGYGKVRAPHYLVVTSEEKEDYLQNIGYTLQGIVLSLTTLSIATCWLGGNIKENLLKGIINVPDGQTPQLMIAFGHPESGKSPLRRSSSEAKRKDCSEITTGTMDITWSRIISAIRLAPSAVNIQPWRFVFNNGKVHVYSSKTGNLVLRHFLTSLNLIDIGIALCHAMIAARHFSRSIKFIEDSSAVNKGYEYVTTIIEI